MMMSGLERVSFRKNTITREELKPPEAVSPSPLAGARSAIEPGPPGHARPQSGESPRTGLLIINADDWGRNRETTDRILDCVARRTVSSVSAMVFMEDSERAGEIARERGVDAGLHINFTTPFSARNAPSRLKERHQGIAAYLLRRRLNQVMFHPGLAGSFEYVVAAQVEEYCRLYGAQPERLDGHHHMHLCANVLLARLLPPGTIVRRNFSFQPGEKGAVNRLYRKVVDDRLARRHRLTDYFFSLPPLEPQSRLERIAALARQFAVEVETHPVNADEYRFLTGGEVGRWAGDSPIAPRFDIPQCAAGSAQSQDR
jgi:chitin disaccharide deacetylase